MSIVQQDFKNGKVDTAFIPKHEDELAPVSNWIDIFKSLTYTITIFIVHFGCYFLLANCNVETRKIR